MDKVPFYLFNQDEAKLISRALELSFTYSKDLSFAGKCLRLYHDLDKKIFSK